MCLGSVWPRHFSFESKPPCSRPQTKILWPWVQEQQKVTSGHRHKAPHELQVFRPQAQTARPRAAEATVPSSGGSLSLAWRGKLSGSTLCWRQPELGLGPAVLGRTLCRVGGFVLLRPYRGSKLLWFGPRIPSTHAASPTKRRIKKCNSRRALSDRLLSVADGGCCR